MSAANGRAASVAGKVCGKHAREPVTLAPLRVGDTFILNDHAGRQRIRQPSFLAFIQLYGKGDEDMPPMAAVTEQRNAARFTVVAAEAVPPELRYYSLKGMTKLNTTLARYVTLRADGPKVGGVFYDTDYDGKPVQVGEVLPSGGTSDLELKVVAQPLEGDDWKDTPRLQLLMLLLPEDAEDEWAEQEDGMPAWLSLYSTVPIIHRWVTTAGRCARTPTRRMRRNSAAGSVSTSSTCSIARTSSPRRACQSLARRGHACHACRWQKRRHRPDWRGGLGSRTLHNMAVLRSAQDTCSYLVP